MATTTPSWMTTTAPEQLSFTQIEQLLKKAGGSGYESVVGAAISKGVESGGNTQELAGGVGPAQGLWQFEPTTWREYGPGTSATGASPLEQAEAFLHDIGTNKGFGSWGPDLGGSYTSNPTAPASGSPVANYLKSIGITINSLKPTFSGSSGTTSLLSAKTGSSGSSGTTSTNTNAGATKGRQTGLAGMLQDLDNVLNPTTSTNSVFSLINLGGSVKTIAEEIAFRGLFTVFFLGVTAFGIYLIIKGPAQLLIGGAQLIESHGESKAVQSRFDQSMALQTERLRQNAAAHNLRVQNYIYKAQGGWQAA